MLNQYQNEPLLSPIYKDSAESISEIRKILLLLISKKHKNQKSL